MTEPLDQLLSSIDNARRRADAEALVPFFKDVTGYDPVIWSGSIVGFGRYHYKYATGREGDFIATGFAPRKASMSIYIMPGYQDYNEILSRLGPHKTGKACLYVTRFDRIDMTVLKELIQAGLRDLSRIYPVFPA